MKDFYFNFKWHGALLKEMELKGSFVHMRGSNVILV